MNCKQPIIIFSRVLTLQVATCPFWKWNVNHNVSEILTHKCHNDCFNEHYVTFPTQRSYWCILFWNYGIYYRFTQLKKHTDDGFQGKNYDEIINSQEFRHAKKETNSDSCKDCLNPIP